MDIFEELYEEDKKKAICRVCLKYDCDEGMSLFRKYNDMYLYEKINYIASIEINQDDNLPDKICSTCLQALDNACDFKQLCERSDAYWRSTPNTGEFLQAPITEAPLKEESMDTDEYENYNFKKISPCSFQEQLNYDNDNTVNIGDNQSNIKSKAIDLKLECHDCGGIFKSKCKLRVHWKKIHLKQQQLICPHCKLTHKTYKAYHNHLKKRTQSCIDSAKVRVEGVGKLRIFYCKECNVSSKRIQTIVSHSRTHTGERPFVCKICNKGFAQQSSLQSHMEAIHEQYIKEMTCELCGKHLKGRNKWSKHMHSHKHENLPCPVCNKRYTSKLILKEHMKRHSGIKSYTCEMCAKTFFCSSDLYNHKMKVHLKTKTYSCELCEYKTYHYRTIYNHRLKHTDNNLACEICGRFVENKQQLLLHKIRHSERNFQCAHCNRTYFSKKNLLSHIRKIHKLKKS